MMLLLCKYQSKALILGDQAIVSGVNFLLGIMLVRNIGLHSFGTFSMVLIVVLGIVAINQALITAPLQSKIDEGDTTDYIKQVKGLQVALIFVFTLVLFIAYQVVTFLNIHLEGLTFLSVLMYSVGALLFDFNRKQLYIQKSYFACTVKDFLAMGFQLIVVFYFFEGTSISLLLWWLSAGVLLVEIPFFIFNYLPKIPNVSIVTHHWVFGQWLLWNALLQWLSGNYFITVGAGILGAELVGVVRIGQSIIGVWNVLLQALENYIPPLAATIYSKHGWYSLSTYLKSLTLKIGGAMLVVAVVLVVFRDAVWELFYGADLLHYTFIMYWFAPILVFNFLGFPFRFALRTVNKTKVLFEAYVLSSIISFVSAHFLIHQFSIHGVCVGLLLTQVVMQLWYVYRLNQISKYESSTHSFG